MPQMKALSGYHIRRIDVTDDSVGSSDDDEADDNDSEEFNY